ncbi:helix-turn-helix domain protein [bacterium BMS3Bbin11]|nr:helix-turn-helix domain protein [bacterium BMS3Abin11]GBE45212.1 helix-turn-helix domain protein [bacterium BMS3Bbin11]HDH08816.1 ArsR family transcriptional regulator [Gammaproteobacteria bacterium]HDH16554.1 ArsR family transcriptional regulator [Gammaproteobacteria bacterium]HDZ79459.1 ArsR family transcriptional regulator [Gammaproteobacteria bacterium]
MLDVFNGLITSKVRARILMRLFLNPDQNAYLRELAKEFDVSPSQIKEELDNLSSVGLLSREKRGRQINYSANTSHSLFPELHSMVKKAMGMDRILESIAMRLGNLELAFVVDDYAEGKDSGLIDLVLVGDIDWVNLRDLVRKTEKYIQRKIRTLVFTPEEFKNDSKIMENRAVLLIWKGKENERQKKTISNTE